MSPVPVDPFNFVTGTTADADQVDARFLELYRALNPALVGIQADNIVDGTLGTAEFADDAVTSRKLGITAGQTAVGAAVASPAVMTDLQSVVVTPETAGALLLVIASFDINMSAAAASGASGGLQWLLDGAASGTYSCAFNNTSGSSLGSRYPVTVAKLFTGLSAAAHTIKLQGQRSSQTVDFGGCAFAYALLG